VQASGLIDTGAILALLDQDDQWHESCTQAFSELRLPLATSAAILAELYHLLSEGRRELEAAWGFLHSGAVTVLPIADADLASLHDLMTKYHDRPMDFADATLVHLAERESLSTVLTVDFDDFETYRVGGRRRFRVFPSR
jgi:hypothetical protein